MIISFKHKFIFVHLGRTGGRSLTEELSEFCGKNDIVTPTGDIEGRNHAGWHRHESASSIREKLGHDTFDQFFVFTVERNPWDKVLSNYWAYKGYRHGQGGRTEQIPWLERLWRNVSGYPWSFDYWLRYRMLRRTFSRSRTCLPSAFRRYTDKQGNLLVDMVFRYEHMRQQIPELANRLQLPIQLKCNQGRTTRLDRSPYEQQYSEYGKQVIDSVFHREIKLLRYQFGMPIPDDIVAKNGHLLASAQSKVA